MSNLAKQAAKELADYMDEKQIKFATIYEIRDTCEEATEMSDKLKSVIAPKRVVPFFNDQISVDNGTYMVLVNLTSIELRTLFRV